MLFGRPFWALFGGFLLFFGATTTTTTTTKQQQNNNKQQTTNNKQQTTNNKQQQPTTNNQQPTTNNQQPTTNNQQPTTNNQQPTTNNQQPTTNNQQPTTNNQQPTTNNQQPTTNNQQPTRTRTRTRRRRRRSSAKLRQKDVLPARGSPPEHLSRSVPRPRWGSHACWKDGTVLQRALLAGTVPYPARAAPAAAAVLGTLHLRCSCRDLDTMAASRGLGPARALSCPPSPTSQLLVLAAGGPRGARRCPVQHPCPLPGASPSGLCARPFWRSHKAARGALPPPRLGGGRPLARRRRPLGPAPHGPRSGLDMPGRHNAMDPLGLSHYLSIN